MTRREKMDIVLKPRKSRLHGLELKEKVDKKLLIKLIEKINNNEIVCPDDYCETKLKNYLKMIDKDGFVRVKYFNSDKKLVKDKYAGRVFTSLVKKKKFSVSYQNIMRYFRHTLCEDYYMDIDMDNAHPVILKQLCKGHCYTDCLEEYVDNRDEILKKVMDQCDVSRDDSKKLFIRLIYGGTVDNWKDDTGVVNEVPKFCYDFEDELITTRKFIIAQNQHFVDIIKKSERNNINSIMSLFLQDIENKILEECFFFLRDNNYIEDNNIATLCFDGIILKKCDNVDELLDLLNKHVFKNTGFDISFSEKKMNEGFDINVEKDVEIKKGLLNEIFDEYCKKYKLTPDEIDDFDISFFQLLSDKDPNVSYLLMKEYWERHFIYVSKDDIFYQIKKKHNRNGCIDISLENYGKFDKITFNSGRDDNGDVVRSFFMKKYMVSNHRY